MQRAVDTIALKEARGVFTIPAKTGGVIAPPDEYIKDKKTDVDAQFVGASPNLVGASPVAEAGDAEG